MPKVAYWAPEEEMASLDRVAGHALEHKEGDRNPVAPVMANACCRMNGITFPEFAKDAYLAFQAFIATSEVVGHDVIVPLIDLSIDGEGFHFAYVPDDCENADDPDAAVKEKWGQKITLFGYVVPATFTYLGTPQEMYNESCRLLDKCMKGGGYVLSCGCECPPNGPFINAIAQCAAAHECGRYDGKTVKLPWDWKDWVLGERRSPAPLPKVEG